MPDAMRPDRARPAGSARPWHPAARIAALALGLTGLGSQVLAAGTEPEPRPASGDFRALPEVSARGDDVPVTLVAAAKDVVVDGVTLHAYVFNGEYGGTLLRVRPGGRLKIHLVNQIDQEINLHFHGSHGSPLGHGDNVHVVVPPGQTFDYVMDVPRSQPPGLYWYHTHIHGNVEELVSRGLTGPIIVEGLESRVPEVRGLKQRLLVLKSFPLAPPAEGADATETNPDVRRLHGVVQSINGAAHSEITMAAGSRELWRISNQSANDYYHLSIKGFRFRIVALDGSATAQDVTLDKLDIGPAMRVEAVVEAPAAGDYPLLSGTTLTGTGRNLRTSRELAMIHVSGAATTATAVPAPTASRPMLAADLRTAKITATRTLSFAQRPGEEIYTINGLTFDHRRVDVRVPLGSIEEWVIRNDSDDMHAFHIHQVHFQVVSINGEPQPFDRLLDVVKIPERGQVVIRMAFTDPQIVGRFMFHCHVLKHEDKGMMQMIEVYDPKHPERSAQEPPMAGMDHMSMPNGMDHTTMPHGMDHMSMPHAMPMTP